MAEVQGNMVAASSFTTGEIDPGCFTGDIGVIETADGQFIFDFDFDFDFDVTKAGLGNMEAAVSFTEGRAMVTEASWIDYVIVYKPEQELLLASIQEERKAAAGEPTTEAAMITKEKVPDSFIEILVKRRPFTKHPPLSDEYSNFLSKYNPELRELWLMDTARINCCVDLHVDVLRQYEEKGFAEVGVDFTGGVKKIFVLP